MTVITFKPRSVDDAEALVVKKPTDYNGCRHKCTEVDETLRIVRCVDCEVQLDPIQVLLDLSKTYVEENWKYTLIQEFEEKQRQKSAKAKQRRNERDAQPQQT